MARIQARSFAAACLLAACLCVTLHCSQRLSGHSTAFAAASVAGVKTTIFSLLPGAVLAGAAYVAHTQRTRASAKTWCGVAALSVVAVAMPWALGLEVGSAALEAPVAAPRQQVAGAIPGVPRSGEERLAGEEQFVRVADPRHPDGKSVEESWQQFLLEDMAEAVKGGQEQVVMIFSRRGCPWCDRFRPVFQKAIANHAAATATDADAALAEGVMPLRVFVFDAEEFPSIMQQFNVEGFPTALVFGHPGVMPRLAPGYQQDEDFEKMLRFVAVAEPEPADGAKKEKKRGLR